MSQPDNGERVITVLDFPPRDGLAMQAIRVDHAPGGLMRGTHGHPAGAYLSATVYEGA
jgi:hypothetical protein